nr:biopolymer transporter Tol [Spelaeicoccus albus]
MASGQRTVVSTVGADGTRQDVFDTRDLLLEAPNWTLDGQALILNGAGRLWRLDLGSGRLAEIAIGDVSDLNNDHVLDPDGEHIFLSAGDGNIYRAPLAGGSSKRITPDDGLLHFLHGVSPDGREIAFIGIERRSGTEWGPGSVYTLALDEGKSRRLTIGAAREDGSEYSRDGKWIYFNTERFDGHAQIARMRTDGSDVQQLTFDESVNWFPHLAPTGNFAVYLAFPPGTEGHPADRQVDVMLVRDGHWSEARPVARVFGGQGTMNVNGWDPSGAQFAIVSYPIEE